ncbi:hypothetical protein PCE1_004606 [Barthelona sp. PCE]
MGKKRNRKNKEKPSKRKNKPNSNVSYGLGQRCDHQSFLHGFANKGQLCWLNSILQVLFQIPSLREELQLSGSQSHIVKNIQKLLEESESAEFRVLKARSLLPFLMEYDPSITQDQQDALHGFLTLTNALHEQLSFTDEDIQSRSFFTRDSIIDDTFKFCTNMSFECDTCMSVHGFIQNHYTLSLVLSDPNKKGKKGRMVKNSVKPKRIKQWRKEYRNALKRKKISRAVSFEEFVLNKYSINLSAEAPKEEEETIEDNTEAKETGLTVQNCLDWSLTEDIIDFDCYVCFDTYARQQLKEMRRSILMPDELAFLATKPLTTNSKSEALQKGEIDAYNFIEANISEKFDRYRSKRAVMREELVEDHLPQVLVLQLKRFDYTGKKNNTPVTVNNTITVHNICYTLMGVIDHAGTLHHGHYTCMIKKGNVSYFCDDSHISQLSISEIDKIQPYLVFYVR